MEELYPELRGDENGLAHEVFAQFSGKRGAPNILYCSLTTTITTLNNRKQLLLFVKTRCLNGWKGSIPLILWVKRAKN